MTRHLIHALIFVALCLPAIARAEGTPAAQTPAPAGALGIGTLPCAEVLTLLEAKPGGTTDLMRWLLISWAQGYVSGLQAWAAHSSSPLDIATLRRARAQDCIKKSAPPAKGACSYMRCIAM